MFFIAAIFLKFERLIEESLSVCQFQKVSILFYKL